MKHVRFLAPASEEMAEAAAWYEQQLPGLGGVFLDQVEGAMALIRRHPEAGADLGEGFRRKLLRQFPFGLIYADGPDEIVVHAVMHLYRSPGYWRHRKS